MGVFLSMEGMDGAGKSTQLRLLADWITSLGRQVVLCRDPGGTPIGESIRQLLLAEESSMTVRTELLLYLSSRSELVDQVIRPALEEKCVVLCDRFLLSSVVYQGHAGGLDPEMIWRIGAEAAENVLPDWTGVLDLDPDESMRRRQGPADRIEQRPRSYHERVRAGYQAEAKRHPDRVCLIDANRPAEEVHEAIRREVGHVLEAK